MSLQTDQLKKELRQLVRELRKAQPESEYMKDSAVIMERLEQLPAFRNAETVMIYWSIAGEVYTHDFIRKWSDNKRFILPSIDGDRMNLKEYTGESNLKAGDLYNIPEPDGRLFEEVEKIEMIIVPGVAFDRNNNRMGRGKAYYDRFLQNLNVYKAGVCFSFQLFDQIPADETDVKMDIVITSHLVAS